MRLGVEVGRLYVAPDVAERWRPRLDELSVHVNVLEPGPVRPPLGVEIVPLDVLPRGTILAMRPLPSMLDELHAYEPRPEPEIPFLTERELDALVPRAWPPQTWPQRFRQ